MDLFLKWMPFSTGSLLDLKTIVANISTLELTKTENNKELTSLQLKTTDAKL